MNAFGLFRISVSMHFCLNASVEHDRCSLHGIAFWF